MYFSDHYFMGGMHGLWWIFWVVLIGALVFYSWKRPSGKNPEPRETPHEMLRRRLASGEITAEQYEERKALLDRDSGAKG